MRHWIRISSPNTDQKCPNSILELKQSFIHGNFYFGIRKNTLKTIFKRFFFHQFQSNIKPPVNPIPATSINISGINQITNIPPGFSIPQSYATNNAIPSTTQEVTEPSAQPAVPSVPQIPSTLTDFCSFPQPDPVSAGATTTTTHLFNTQPSDVSFSHGN